MPAYSRGEIGVEAYLVRIIAALCRQNGGELRVKGELIDTVGEATALLKSWDQAKQELVLTVSMGTFGEVFRVIPEPQAKKTVVSQTPANGSYTDPLDKLFNRVPDDAPQEKPRSASTIEDPEKLANLEMSLRKRKIARMLREEMEQRKRTKDTV